MSLYLKLLASILAGPLVGIVFIGSIRMFCWVAGVTATSDGSTATVIGAVIVSLFVSTGLFAEVYTQS